MATGLSLAQDETLVSGQFDNTSLTGIFRQWKNENNLHFAFDTRACDEIYFTGTFKSETVADALSRMLSNTKFRWMKIEKTYVIYPVQDAEEGTPERFDFAWSAIVRDEKTREPLPFAHILIEGTTTGATANEHGKFYLAKIPSDTSLLVISYVGYETLRFRLTPAKVKNLRDIFLNESIGLLPQAIVFGDDVQLLSTTETVGLMQVSAHDLSTISALGENDVMKAAQLLPGVDGTSENSGGVLIRGSDTDQSMVTMDGFTLYHLDHFFGVYSAVNPHIIKNIRIHKGALGAAYGGRIAGIVEMISKDGNKSKPSARLDLGLLSVAALVESPVGTSAQTSVIVAARRAYTDVVFSPVYRYLFNNLYNTNITAAGSPDLNLFGTGMQPDFGFFDFTAKISTQVGEHDFLSFTHYRGSDKLNFNFTQSSPDEDFVITYSDRSRWGNAGYGLTWRHLWNERSETKLVTGYSRFSAELFSSDSSLNVPGKVTLFTSREEENSLTDFSSRLDHTWIKKRGIISTGIIVNQYQTEQKFISGETTSLPENNNHTASLISAYVSGEWVAGKTISIEAGLRVGGYTPTGALLPEPRLNMRFPVKDGFALKASAGIYHQIIQRVQVQNLFLNNPDYWQLSDDEIVPVLRSKQFTAGSTFHKKGWVIDFEIWHKSNAGVTENVSLYTFTAGNDSTGIITGHGKLTGFDFLLQKDYRRHHFWLAVTAMISGVNHFETYRQHQIHEKFYQNLEVKFIYQLKLGKFDLSSVFYFGSGKRYTPLLGTYDLELVNGTLQKLPVFGSINGSVLPAYHRLDVAASYTFAWGKTAAGINISLFNIYNKVNLRDYQFYALNNSAEGSAFAIGRRGVELLGFTPSVNITVNF